MKPPHLRLVTAELKPPARKRRGPVPPLFNDEQARLVRAAIKTARGLFGSYGCLAAAMYMSKGAVMHAAYGGTITGDLAIRLARALGVPLEALTTPGLRLVPFPKVCPTCGRGDP